MRETALTRGLYGHRKRRGRRTQWMLTLGEKKIPCRIIGGDSANLRQYCGWPFSPSRRLYPETLYTVVSLLNQLTLLVPAANTD